MDIKNVIEEFILKIQLKYPKLHIGYEYDKESDEYDIWHNDSELEFNSEEFSRYCSELAGSLFYKNDIFNFTFGYNYDESKLFENNFYKDINDELISYKYTQDNSNNILWYNSDRQLDNMYLNQDIKYIEIDERLSFYNVEKSSLVDQELDNTFYPQGSFKEVA